MAVDKMKGNPHYSIAKEMSAEYGIKHATLTMAFEQRTVALISYLNWVDTHNRLIDTKDYENISNQIRERIGLG